MKARDSIGWILGAAALYSVYKIWQGGSAVAGYVADVADHVSNAIGGGAYDLVNGDANAQVQSQFDMVMAALKAKGNPPVGSPDYNDVLAQFGMPPAPST